MTTEQIKLLKDINSKDDGTGKRLAGSINYIFNGEVAYCDSRDYIVCDDANELIHIVHANTENPVEQARFPFRITTGFYENLHYMEALYDMSNFQKAVQALLVDSGLINDAQKEHIMKWASGIRNQVCVPKQPGPYFKDTILPVGRTPEPEIRDDGLHHASPTNMYTYEKKIEDIIIPAVEGSDMAPIKQVRGIYNVEMEVDELPTLPNQIKAIIESFPKNDLFMASFTDNKGYAIYNPKDETTIEKFTDNVALNVINNFEHGSTRMLILYIEAYNVRFDVTFYLHLKEDEFVDPSVVASEIAGAANEFIDNFESSVGSELTRIGTSVSATISTTDIGDDVEKFIEFFDTLEKFGVETVTYKTDSTNITLNIGDVNSIESFKKGVIDSMPDINNAVVNGSVEAVSSTGASVVYTLKVKYFNEAECPASVNGVYYATMQEAANAAPDGSTILMSNDTTYAETFDIASNITLDGANHTVEVSDLMKAMTINGSDVTLTNLNVANTTNSGRCVDTRGNITNLALSNLALNTTGSGNTQALTIGGNQNGVVAKVDISNSTAVSASDDGYGIIIFNQVDMTIKDTDVDGYAAIYFKGVNNSDGSANSIVNIINSNVTSHNNNNGSDDNFGTIVFEDDNIIVNIDGGTLNAIATGTANQYAVLFNNCSNCTVTLSGDITVNGKLVGVSSANSGTNNKLIIKGGTYDNDPTNYLADGYVATLTDGLWFVTEMSTDEKIDNVIANVDAECDTVVIEADETINNTYNITTSATLSESGLFDSIAAVNGLETIVVTDGSTSITYAAGDDLESFKASVDALAPKSNTDPEVTLTMTVTTI